MSSTETAATVSRIVGVISSMLAVGVIGVSGTLLNQSVGYRDEFFYGGGIGALNGGVFRGYNDGRFGGYNGGGYNFGGGAPYYNQEDFGGTGYMGGMPGLGVRGRGFDYYKYQKVMAIAGVALGAGVIQFLVSMLLCCVNENTAKGLGLSYVTGAGLVILLHVLCFGAAIFYRVLYPYYIYPWYQFSYSWYTQVNPEGVAFCAVLGINALYLLISAIVAGVFTQQAQAPNSNLDERLSIPMCSTPTHHRKYEYRV